MDTIGRSGRDGAEDGEVQASSERLHDLIREDIVEGRLEPGSRLKTAELAARYGTSVNPVREALHHLQGEGIVVIEPNRGARVRTIGADYARNVYDIRALLEPYLTRWFVSTATAEQIATLEELQTRMENPDNSYEEHRALNDRFHTTMFRGHYNHEAVTLEVRQRKVLDLMNRRFDIAPARRRKVHVEHRAIIEAIRSGDGEQAARVAEEHVRGASQYLVDRLRSAGMTS
ncbi:GntR family transcriptional regulator [Aureimonas phyllosphaerae]|uniref:GntR family transcriptional regulator n=1 Tax=Aureimonas phyllosphaerae TaxID=1166078 RepID=UPI003A5C753B